MVATVVTAKVSNRSAAMPAQSPTLSPTLSAMVAGLRGSSSGMPASTLPTMSPPTSAPLVKMPPPRRAKIEISEAPKPRPTSDSTMIRLWPVVQRQGPAPSVRKRVIAGHGQQAQAHHQHAGDGAGAERDRQAGGQAGARGFGGAHIGAHAEHTCRHSRPAPDRHRADQEAQRDLPAQEEAGEREDHHADDGDGGVLAVEIGGGAFLDGRGDFLHAGVAGRQAQHRTDGPKAIEQRKHARRPARVPNCMMFPPEDWFEDGSGDRPHLE